MCRFIAYMGNPIILDDVLYKPKYSLIMQSIRARETDEPLNGDGFGLGWYAQEIDSAPALFVSIQPAWNDQNLQHLAPKIRSNCFFAHVRAASIGLVSQLNCHPFNYKRFLFMHNGDIADFQKIKRYLRRGLSDEAYDLIKGQTDSEHMFAFFLDILKNNQNPSMVEAIGEALIETIHQIKAIQRLHNVRGANYINVAITDGCNLVAVRYVSDKKLPPASLHFSLGSRYEYENGATHMHPVLNNDKPSAVLVVSEKLTTNRAEWQDIPENHMLLVREDFSTRLQAVK